MPSRSAYIILASVLFGVLVWFSVAMSEQYQVSIAAPLQIERVPDGRALRTPVPPALQLRLRGNGWQLASLLWASNLNLRFPAQLFQGTHRAITRQDVAEIVAARPGIQLADMTPEQLEAIEGIGPKTVEKISIAVNNYFASLEGGEAVAAGEPEGTAGESEGTEEAAGLLR